MKKLMLIAAVAMAASPALASKARQTALGDSRQINDFQQAFERPYLFNSFGTMATFEWGTNSKVVHNANATELGTKAEGGFLKSNGDMAYGIYLGRLSSDFNSLVTAANGGADLAIGTNGNNRTTATSFLYEQNPINLMYSAKAGDLTWGVSFKYSSGKEDANDKKSNTMGVAAGVTNGTWEVEAIVGLAGKTEVGSEKIESKGNTKIGVGYKLSDSMVAFADYKTTKSEATLTSPTNLEVKGSIMNVGFINTVAKSEGLNAFYGVKYSMTSTDQDGVAAAADRKVDSTTLPVWIGVEADASSWMVVRGSVVQSILINETKTKTSTTDTKASSDDIAFNFGVGLKLGKGMLDATFGTASAGHVSFSDGTTDKFLSTVAYTYNF